MGNPRIAIITDSTSDLTPELYELNGIDMVPLYIIWGGEQFRDRIDIQPDEFYQRLNCNSIRPKTSQPRPQDFLLAFQAAIKKGAQELVVIPLSDALSGTAMSARQAAAELSIPVTVADTKATSMSLGWQVLAAARIRNAGGSVKAIIEGTDLVRQKLVLLVMLDTIEFLSKGGRIGNAARLLNSVLNVKPQVWLNHFTGKVEVGELARTRLKAIDVLYHGFFRRLGPGKKIKVAVLHNAAINEAKELIERIRNEFEPDELILADGSPVLGVHTGPRALALCGYVEDQPA